MAVLSKLSSDLPDLPLLAIISQMTLEDRVSAHQVCPRWCHRVQEVNRVTVPSLTIVTCRFGLSWHSLDYHLNLGSIASEPSVQLLTSIEKEEEEGKPQIKHNSPQPLFPPFCRHTKWNCFKFEGGQCLTPDTACQIMSAFAGTTELTFLSSYPEWQNLSADQTDPADLITIMISKKRGWKSRLTTLRIFNHLGIDMILGPEFYNALNHLPALKNLTFFDVNLNCQQELPILRQLKLVTISFKQKQYYQTFFRSLQKYKLENEVGSPLQMILTTHHSRHIYRHLLKLDLHLRQTIVSLNELWLDHFADQKVFYPMINGHFPNLISVKLFCSPLVCDFSQVFSKLGHNLPKLLHLSVSIDFISNPNERKSKLANVLPTFSKNCKLTVEYQLVSVQALDLSLKLSGPNSHDQLCWLNIGHLMPNLKAIHLTMLECEGCRNRFWSNTKTKTACLQDLLKIVAKSTDLPPERIAHRTAIAHGARFPYKEETN